MSETVIEFHTHAKVVDEEKRKGGTSKKMPSWDRIFYGNFVINVAGDEFGNVDCGLSLTSTFISALKKILLNRPRPTATECYQEQVNLDFISLCQRIGFQTGWMI